MPAAVTHSSPKFTPQYGKFLTPARELKVGDVFWHSVMIAPDDVAEPSSDTARDVRNNRRTRRLVVVVCTSPVLVLYLATFNRATKLPCTLKDHTVWYPVDEAETTAWAPPLQTEPMQRFAQWVNIRRLYAVSADSVPRIGGFHFPEEEVRKVTAALLLRLRAEYTRHGHGHWQ
ncbi:hypothetical protein BC835DRAFT_599782 [Cytidiella melzeri]|nr:hypothetical protein BC835DRAFT_599782 [Cytidiella melzeri]